VVESLDAGLVHAEGAHPVIGQVTLEPGCVRALWQPEAASPVAEPGHMRGDARGQLEPHPGIRGEQRKQRVRGRRGPELNRVELPERLDEVTAVALECLLRKCVVLRGAPKLGGEPGLAGRLEPGGVLLVDGSADLAQEAQVALPGVASQRLELVA
jgi:hypothetical protein